MSNDITKTLVIGSSGHSHVTCVEWEKLSSINIVDYEYVVINTRSLTAERMKKLPYDFFKKIRAGLLRLLLSPGGRIFCVGGPLIKVSLSDYSAHSNYDWSPINIGIGNETGDTIEWKDIPFIKYLDEFKSWQYFYYLPQRCLTDQITDVCGEADSTTYYRVSHPYVENRYQKMLCGFISLGFKPPRANEDEKMVLGAIELLPYLERLSQEKAVSLLLEDILHLPQITPPPNWVEEIQMPLIPAMNETLSDKAMQIDKLQSEIASIENEVRALEKYKGLLYLSGKELERLFAECLELCGANIQPARYSDEEFVMEYKQNKYLIECKGVSKSIARKHVVQLLGYIANYEEQEGDAGKGILFGNAWKDSPPNERDTKETRIFPDNVISQAATNDIALVSSIAFFGAFCRFLNKEISGEQILNTIISTSSVVDFLSSPGRPLGEAQQKTP